MRRRGSCLSRLRSRFFKKTSGLTLLHVYAHYNLLTRPSFRWRHLLEDMKCP